MKKLLSTLLVVVVLCTLIVIPVSAASSITTDKAEYTIHEMITITVTGVTEEQIESNAFVAIYKKGARHDNHIGLSEYIFNIAGDKWEVNAPPETGEYEIRLYATDPPDSGALLNTFPLSVKYITDRTATVELDKNAYAPNEEIIITTKGLTEAQIESNAFVAIYKKNARHDNHIGLSEYVFNMAGDIWKVNAPGDVGDYEVRLYAVDPPVADALLISVPFNVSGEPIIELTEGTNGLSGWAVPEVKQAINNNLVTDKVMVEFQKAITREEFCELAVKLYEKMTGKTADAAPADTFTDTQNPQVLKANKLGIVEGIGNGLFAPSNSVTRQEIATMLLRTLKIALPAIDTNVANPPAFIDNEDIADWARDGINYFAAKDIIKGAEGAFLPLANCTCEAAIVLVKRVFDTFSAI